MENIKLISDYPPLSDTERTAIREKLSKIQLSRENRKIFETDDIFYEKNYFDRIRIFINKNNQMPDYYDLKKLFLYSSNLINWIKKKGGKKVFYKLLIPEKFIIKSLFDLYKKNRIIPTMSFLENERRFELIYGMKLFFNDIEHYIQILIKKNKIKSTLIEGKKTCSKCGIEKPFEYFYKRSGVGDGYRPFCKECESLQKQGYRNKKQYWKSVKYKKYSNAYRKKRRVHDVNYNLALNLRNRLLSALKSKGVKKTQKATDLIGCSIEELKIHLEKQFKEGMSWDNHSRKGWHIDHIIPCTNFDLSDIEQQKTCFNYKNLQPLWSTENLKKFKKIRNTSTLAQNELKSTQTVSQRSM